ncbi:hypothetical protein DYB25_006270 [Aphanomyces astaci]|uniref:Uncharacterized protein n=2 Tax=Aphanomyces astaci TaxID=112090 RepID=A0A397BQJ0_APHAT|nr:hypothetical protein DYB25_006270 [Aphanomyces astaci]
MTGTSATVEYTKVACPFGDSAFTCTHPECNNTYIYQDIVNTFAANQGCSGDQCITNYLPSVCKLGANVTNTSSANKLACTNRIVSFCASNPTDPGCGALCPYACTSQPNCPCRSDACAAVYKAPLCVRTAGACASFKASLKSELFRQRFFQPKSANLAYAKNNAGPPSGPFVWSQALTDAKASCNAIVPQLGDNLATCVQTSFAFCNANPWQTGCQNDLSTCGDGFVSWMESCDEGNLTASGGCDATCRTAPRWECYQQGTPCKRCIHATGYKVDGVNPASMCPFCYNLIKNMTTPCSATAFSPLSLNASQALASDNYAAIYCAAIAANDLQLSDFFPFVDSDLIVNGGPVSLPNQLGRLVVTQDGSIDAPDDCRLRNFTESLTTSPDETTQAALQVAMAASNEVFSDTVSLFWAVVTTGTKPKMMKNVPNYCGVKRVFNSTINPLWLSNPCCNSDLAEFMCCLPQDVPHGTINVITGLNKEVVDANCPLNADLMFSFLNGAYVGLTSAQDAVNALDMAYSTDAQSIVDSLQRLCDAAIMNATSQTCQTDDDCSVCSQSQCQMDPITLAGTCTVPYDNLVGCTIECIRDSMDPLMLRYLKHDWNLTSANSDQDFAMAFVSVATDVGCAGPLAKSDDIGTTKPMLVCNATCQVAHMCDDTEYQFYLRRNLHNPRLDFSVASTCTNNGGRSVCATYLPNGNCQSYQCTFDTIQTDCKAEAHCISQCQLPLTAGGAAASVDGGACCAMQTVVANQTACLSKTSCNNKQVANNHCNDPTPFCAKCSGKDCVSVTKPPTCLIEVQKPSDCPAAGGTWNPSLKQCMSGKTTITASDCFIRPDLCPSVTNFTSFYTVVPLYPRRTTRCLFGCYLPSISKTSCLANTKYTWDGTHGNGSGICVGRRNAIKTLASCTTEGGVFLNATKSYFPGAFATQDQCDQGKCIGSPSNDGWSSSQCLNLTFGTCSVPSHPMGCRVSGVWDTAVCGVLGGTWYTRSTTEAECSSYKQCRERGVDRVSKKNATECAKCKGVMAPLFKWTPGRWSGPSVESYTWNADGTHLTPVNQYVMILI